VVSDLVERLTFDAAKMESLAGAGYADATELADYLVRKGVPFRDAHAQAAEGVQLAISKGVALAGLSPADFKTVNPKIGPDVQGVLGPKATMAAKTSPGGTAPARAKEAQAQVAAEVAARTTFFAGVVRHLGKVEADLLKAPTVVKAK
jgi:argininosuccinate lyase